MVCPRKIMADRETQQFERLNFLKGIVKKVDRRVCQTVLSERDSERVYVSPRAMPLSLLNV